ncbi:MAG: hypothetical protein ABI950_02440 [Solirubrobacteraceae bacterium]
MLRRLGLPVLLLLLALPAGALAHGNEVTHSDTPAELADGSIVRALSTSGGSPTGLPTSWCGSRLLTDDVIDAAQPAAAAVVKVVYAYAADRTDRSATWTPALQGNASTIDRFLAEQSGGGRAVGFDMGTSCGPQYLDVTVVPLPRARSSYLGDVRFDALRDDVLAALGPATGARDVVIMADEIATTSPYGLGEVMPGQDDPGASNPHNDGGLTAAIYSMPGSSTGVSGWQPTMMLHEITHNLGAVQPSAPHSTPNGHCWDGRDVMCYSDGSTGSQPYTTTACPSVPGTITDVYDCGHDDYYDPAAVPGSYLDTHWNVYRSVFMSPCTGLGDACGDLARTLAPPVSSAAPEVQGTPQAGEVLVGTVGTWQNAPTSFRVRWQQEFTPGLWYGVRDGDSYPVGLPDIGARLRTVVTASNADGSTNATSAPTAAVLAPRSLAPTPAAPTPGAPPIVTTVVPAPKPAPAAAGPTPVATPLQIVLRGGGRVAARLTTRVATAAGGIAVTSTAVRARAARGRWRLKLCAAATGQPRRCVLGPRARAAHGTVRLSALRVLLRTTSTRVTVTAALVDGSARAAARGTATTR